MSINLSNAASKEFDAMVKQSYQAKGGKLRTTVTQRTNVVGDNYTFRLIGKAIANERGTSQSDLNVLGLNYNTRMADLKNYYAAEYTDIFDAAEVNFDEKQALADAIAMAIKRREDQIIIDALNNANLNSDNYIDNEISGSADNLTVDAVIKAGEILDNAYADGQKYMLITPAMRSNLLKDDKVTQSLYTNDKPLSSGQLFDFAGFRFIVIESARSEGGLIKLSSAQNGGDTNDIVALAYVQNAVGIAIAIDMKTEVNYIAEKTSWLTTGVFKAGAKAIDYKGIVKVFCKNS